jgi:hypothetical protein
MELLWEIRRVNKNLEKFFQLVGPGFEKHELIQSIKNQREQRLAAASRYNKQEEDDNTE